MKLFSFSILGFFLLLVACSSPKTTVEVENAIGEVNNTPITMDELMREYHKTKPTDAKPGDTTGLQTFANLYLTYKSKLIAAMEAGYFDDSALKSELKNYEEQYAYPFWLEKKIEDDLLAEMIERDEIEINASHILISVAPEALPEDTLKAYNRLLEARKKILEQGLPFDQISSEYSSVRMGRSMGGKVGYFSAGKVVKPFEDVAYSTPVDSISMPVRTQFGYHVIKVLDRRPKQPERQVSHIFMNASKNEADSIIVRMEQAWDSLEAGKSWEEVVMQFSQDSRSIRQKGYIGWVANGQYAEVLSDSIFSIKESGTYTRPFYSGYGVQIIRLDSIRTYNSEEDRRADLLTRLKSMPRYKNNKESTFKNVRAHVGHKKYVANADKFKDFLWSDSTRPQRIQSVIYPSELKELVLLTLGDRTFTGKDYGTFLGTKFEGRDAGEYRYFWYDDFVDAKTEEIVVATTKEVFPEFKRTVQDYHNGLVIFKITEDSVWNYAKQDTAALLSLYEKNKEKYWFDERYHYWRISHSSDSIITLLQTKLANGMSIDTLKAQHPKIYMLEDTISDISEAPFSKLGEMENKTVTEVFEYKNRKTIFYLQEKLSPAQMTFDEAFFRLVAEYQPKRELAWNSNIRERYQARLYENKVQQLVQRQ